MDRLIQRNNFLLTELNVHRVIITAVLLAAKFFDDAYYNNAYYAKVGGVLVSEMNGLEVDFLFRINFSLHVPPEVFHQYRTELLSQATVIGVEIPSLQFGTASPSSTPQKIHSAARAQAIPPVPCHNDPVVVTGSVPYSAENMALAATSRITPSPPSMATTAAMTSNFAHSRGPHEQNEIPMVEDEDDAFLFPVQRSHSEPPQKYAPTSSLPASCSYHHHQNVKPPALQCHHTMDPALLDYGTSFGPSSSGQSIPEMTSTNAAATQHHRHHSDFPAVTTDWGQSQAMMGM